ncbi:MAG: PGF-pre-PGF domain-containing protein [Thermoplasmatales archaeon]|nr:MAG: PGF-pre-PGF domain-containing protein [Thermoplasmatales archaeon]
MRKIYNFNNKHLTKRILHKKFLINFIVFFLILEFLLIPFSVTSLVLTDNPDGDEMSTPSLPTVDDSTTNSGGDSSSKDEAPAGSDDKSSADNTSNGSSDDSSVVNDTSTEPSDDDIIVDDKISDSSDGSSIEDDLSNESSLDNLIDDKNDSLVDDNLTYAPNERNVSTDEIVSISENTLGDLSSGMETEVNIEYFEDIDSVTLTPATDLEEVKVTIIKLKDKPEEIIDPPKKDVSVYNYLDIKLVANDTYVEEDELESLEFKFKVEKSWIYNNKVDRSTIKLIRYHDGIWQNLSTTIISENESYIYYTSQSPGFSTFAVVGSKVVEKGESYSSDNVNIPWSIIIGFILLLTIMLIFILIKARYIYLKDESK